MNNSILLYFLFFIVSISVSLGQKRKMYVDNFSNILGNHNLEIELFIFVKENNIDQLILYDLNKINKRFPLGDATQKNLLAKFITSAKIEYGLKSVSASGETSKLFIEAIHPYNLSRSKPEERFDIYI